MSDQSSETNIQVYHTTAKMFKYTMTDLHASLLLWN